MLHSLKSKKKPWWTLPIFVALKPPASLELNKSTWSCLSILISSLTLVSLRRMHRKLVGDLHHLSLLICPVTWLVVQFMVVESYHQPGLEPHPLLSGTQYRKHGQGQPGLILPWSHFHRVIPELMLILLRANLTNRDFFYLFKADIYS